MTKAERWRQVKELLYAALECGPEGRAAFLAEVCAGDEALRHEVEALLVSYERAGSFFELPAAEVAARALAEGQAESLVGRKVGPYQILSRLGAGAMGDVYLARDGRLGRKVALKLLPPHFARDAERLLRFRQEASAASRLNHPNILTVHEVGRVDSTHYIATEHVEGLTLRELMALKRVGVTEALDVATQVASALAAAHAAGIVHRDVKPENIMLRRDGYVKVLDFGIAKLLEDSAWGAPGDSQMAARAFKTDPGMMLGTVTYMSPEQARGLEVDARTDIWSLGVVLYELITGRVPFEGSSIAEVLVSILEREAAPLSDLSGGVPAELWHVVRRTLAKDRGERYARVEDLARDLSGIKRDLEFASHLRLYARADPGVAAPHEAGAHPPGRGHGSPANNLSVRLPLIVGRAVEIAAVEELLRGEEARLLTLTGPGGTGKTRLGQQVARDLLDEFDDGVFFVPLAPISDHHLVAAALAQALGVQETSARGFAEGLKSYLGDKRMLLVLDNFEHVTAAAPFVAELLSACPGLKILVTSRAALRVSGEREFRVPPLALPALDGVRSADDLMQCGAAVLFVQRVLAARPQFELTDENAPTVAEICIRLDGLPLALELAAARTKLLSLEEMLARMNPSLKLLKGGARDWPERQQTMRATIAWSYDLLRDDARTLCRRQAVFFGGSTLGAAEAVCGEAGGVEIDVLDGLESLVDESLLLKKESADGAYRFLMLETIREYGLERLEASDEGAELRRRHANFFLALAEEVEPRLTSAGHEPWLVRLDAEHNNLRAALRWAVDNGDAEMGLRLVGALRWFWYYRGHFGEGYHWATQLLSMPGAAPRTEARAKALLCAGSLAFYYSDPAAACPLLEESVALWRELGNLRYLAYALTFACLPISLVRLDFDAACAAAEEGVALFRQSEDRWGLALALTYAGVIMWAEPSAEKQATAHFEEAVALFRSLGDEWGAGGSILYLAALRQEHGDNAAARALYEEFVAIMRESKDLWRLASGLDILAELLRSEGEHARAEALAEESLTLQQKLGKSLNLRKTWNQMKKRARPDAGR
jgi:predicted ATPase/serine/threonine protein kinase